MSRRIAIAAGTTALLLAAAALIQPPAEAHDRLAPNVKGRAKTALVELGRRLFFDPVVSRTGTRSCAGCHDPEHGFADSARVSEDDIGLTARHSQTIIDSALNPSAHWDGEFESIEALVIARIGLPLSRGKGYGDTGVDPLPPGHSAIPFEEPRDPEPEKKEKDYDDDKTPRTPGAEKDAPRAEPQRGKDDAKSEKDSGPKRARDPDARDVSNRRLHQLAQLPRAQDVLEEAGRYAEGFRAVWGNRTVTRIRIAQAIAAYCRSVHTTESPFDRFLAGDGTALTPRQIRGLKLFKGRAGCAQCHLVASRKGRKKKPAFTDFEYHNTGISWLHEHERGPDGGPERMRFEITDSGRQRVSTSPRHRRAFKTPTLRDLTRRGPYMHTGAFKTLHEVVRHYARGGSKDPKQDVRIRPFDVTDTEVDDLVAFLGSLTGDERPGLAQKPCRQRSGTTRLRFVDAASKPLPNLEFSLIPAGDTLPAEKGAPRGVLHLETDKMGRVEYTPPAHTHYRIVLPDELTPQGGPLVPDICRSAEVVVPVKGRVRFTVLFDSARDAPETLVVEHQGTLVFDGHEPPRTRFVRLPGVQAGKVFVAAYEGWMRTDVPAVVHVRVPGDKRRGLAHEIVLGAKKEPRLDLRR